MCVSLSLSLCVCVCVFVEVVIGLEMTEYTVGEQEENVTVCAIVMSGTIDRDVEVTFTSGNPGTATSM